MKIFKFQKNTIWNGPGADFKFDSDKTLLLSLGLIGDVSNGIYSADVGDTGGSGIKVKF